MEEYPREKGLENQVTEFKYRLTFIEKDLLGTKQQLQHYVSTKENDLQLKNIQITVNLIEQELQDSKKRLNPVISQFMVQK